MRILQADAVQVAAQLLELRGALMRPAPIADVVVGESASVGDGEHGLEEMRGHHRREIPFELYEHCGVSAGGGSWVSTDVSRALASSASAAE